MRGADAPPHSASDRARISKQQKNDEQNRHILKRNIRQRFSTCRVVGRSNNNANANGGLVYANANNASSNSNANNGSRLANRTTNINRTYGTASRDDAQPRARKPNRSNSDARHRKAEK